MGLFDLFSSKSSSKSENNAVDKRAAAGRDQFQLQQGATLKITDQKLGKAAQNTARSSVKANTRLGKAALKSQQKTSAKAINTVSRNSNRSLNTVRRIVGDQSDLIRSTTGQFLDFASGAITQIAQSNEDETARTSRSVVPWLMMGVAAVAIATAWGQRK